MGFALLSSWDHLSVVSSGNELISVQTEIKNECYYCKLFLAGDWQPNLFSTMNLNVTFSVFGQSKTKFSFPCLLVIFT